MRRNDIFRLIVQHAREVVPELTEQQIEERDSLVDLGANSMDRTEIIILLLESLNLKIPLIDLEGATCIGELTDLVYAKSPGTSQNN